MKAVQIHEYGDVDVLKYEDAPDPKPAYGEVVVKVKACALNHGVKRSIWSFGQFGLFRQTR